MKLAARPLGDKTPASKTKQEEEKGLFNLAWKSAGLDEAKKGLNSTWTDEDLDSNAREDAALVGLNEKHMACERIEKKKVTIRLRNDHTGHENGGTGSGTLKPFYSDSGACVDVSKSNTRMSTYDIGMYQDTRGHFQVGSVSEGRFGIRKCTIMGTWAGTQRGVSRGFYTVYAGRIRSRITRERNMSLAIDESPTHNSKERISRK